MKGFIVIITTILLIACDTNLFNAVSNHGERHQLTQEEKASGLLTPSIMWKFEQVGEPKLSPDGKNIVYSSRKYLLSENKSLSSIYMIASMGERQVKRLTIAMDATDPVWSAEGLLVYFLSNKSGSKQIWAVNPFLEDPKPFQVSDIAGGIISFLFSPKGDKVLYTKQVQIDKSTEQLYPEYTKAKVRIIEDLMYRHWDTWKDGKYSHIFVAGYAFDRLSGERDINEGEAWDSPIAPDFDIRDICWDKNAENIYYTSKKMSGREAAISTNSSIYRYNLQSRQTENLTEPNKGYDRRPTISPNGQKMAWLSMSTPGCESDQAYILVMDLTTNKIENITFNFAESARSICWGSDTSIYFISGINATYQVFEAVLKMPIRIEQKTSGEHDFTDISAKGNNIIGRCMSMNYAPELFRVDMSTSSISQITTTNSHLYSSLRFGKVEQRWIRTTDGKQMLTWVVYPPNFDAEKKYPALLYCQGGPQQAVSQFWSWRWNLQLMAAQGYIVIAPNRRGVPTFGKQWCAQISGDYAGQNIRDYYSAIDALKLEPYIDENKLGALGASYGGYSVYYLAGTHNKRFKAFAAHNGMFNMQSMYGTTEEMFFVNHDFGGAYWNYNSYVAQNTYAKSPHNLVHRWNTPILISVGEHDYRVPYTEGMQAFNAAQLQQIPSKFLFFPEETHFIAQPQNAVVWHTELFNWFNTYLQK
ncbi:MAG: S9 family peptidase [Bacteroidales bacterium]